MNIAKAFILIVLAYSATTLAQDQSPTQNASLSVAGHSETVPFEKPPQDTSETYKIGAGDLLIITVWKETALSGSYLVRPDGMISIPLLGDVQASACTPARLAGELESKLKKYIQNPSVTVQISQIHSKVVYLLGEVTKKGPIDLAPGMTVLQAIASAGGLTDYANSKKIYILRNDGGRQVKIAAHYKEALKGDASVNVPLQPGDTIVVP